MLLGKLAYAEGASWNPDLACLDGTRKSILSVIDLWSRSLDGQNVFWLKGVAGSGKSTIAHTVAHVLHERGALASSFFLDRNDPSRNTLKAVCTTFAQDIAARHPAMATDICEALESDPSLPSAPFPRQFEAFIAGPLRRHRVDSPMMIVIDALDETIDDASCADLLTLLRDEASKIPSQLRIFVTSRPTWNITRFLSRRNHVQPYDIDIRSFENKQDIKAYVESKLRHHTMGPEMGPDWPDEALIAELILMSEGLFIWISTICSWLHSAYQPRSKLTSLLSKTRSRGLPVEKKMDALYAAILEAAGDWEDEDFVRDYKLVMGAVMALKRPLSVSALQALYSSSQVNILSSKDLLARFGSVLVGFSDEQEPIRMLHLSFREFITDRAGNNECTRKFCISSVVHSRRLAELCLHMMVVEFTSKTFHGTGYLARKNNDGPGIPKIFGISEQLLYSCEYWGHHLLDVDIADVALTEVLSQTLLNHSRTWIEIVCSESVFRESLFVRKWLKVGTNGFCLFCWADYC